MFVIEMSTDNIKPVVTEKCQFECRLESDLIALFIFRIISILIQGPSFS